MGCMYTTVKLWQLQQNHGNGHKTEMGIEPNNEVRVLFGLVIVKVWVRLILSSNSIRFGQLYSSGLVKVQVELSRV